MDIIKHKDFFNPYNLRGEIHIIGCGAVGSTIAENLTRLGIKAFTIWDFDTICAHNIANQMFLESQIGMAKTDAVIANCTAINSELQITKEGRWDNDPLSGYVFLAVDNIELRKQIVESCRFNPNVIAIFDCRMGLVDAQHYAAERNDTTQMKKLLSTMNFTHEEAKEATPQSACGTSLNVVTTVRMIVALCVSNFINYTLGKGLKTTILIDAFDFSILFF